MELFSGILNQLITSKNPTLDLLLLLVIASIGLQLGVINDVIFSILVLVAFVTTLIPPLSLGAYLKKTRGVLP